MSRLFAVRWPSRLVLVALALALAVPAAAQESSCYFKSFDAEGNPVGPAFCTQQVWFSDSGTKAGNLAATGATKFPSWDTTAPTTSVTGGAGGGYFSQGAPRQVASDPTTDPAIGATFAGTFTGDIDNMVVEMYLFAPLTAAANTPGAYVGSVDMTIDGQKVLPAQSVDFQLVPGGQAVMKTKFAITDVQAAMEAAGVSTGPDAVHNMRLFFGAFGLVSATSVIVYDTTEVPGGITFNAPTLPEEMTKVSAG